MRSRRREAGLHFETGTRSDLWRHHSEVPELGSRAFGAAAPHAKIAKMSRWQLHKLRELEAEIDAKLERGGGNFILQPHRFGANKGLNFGMSVVPGGKG
eukprot:COSAG01_NODE_24670_length_771_cov_0.848214_1_plen_98_part_01